MARRDEDKLPFNPKMFLWARELAEFDLEEVTPKFPKIEQWESGDATPTVNQARDLAKFYNRSFTEFFRSSPPDVADVELVPDFRLYRHADDPSQKRVFKEIHAWAESIRINAIELYESLSEPVPSFPKALRASLDDDPEELALVARDVLNFTMDEQFSISPSKQQELPNILKSKLEDTGILVLKNSKLSDAEARGICFAVFPLPLIVYGNEAPTAQAFTIIHELGHILLQQSAIIGAYSIRDSDSEEWRMETWCNRFSASFLIPRQALSRHLKPARRPFIEIDDDSLSGLAKIFRVSPHAMLIRLIEIGYVDSRYYWEVKRPEFEAEEKNFKSFGRPKYYGSRFKNSVGDLYTGLVIDSWQNGRISNHNAAELMGIKNIAHLFDIKENFSK